VALAVPVFVTFVPGLVVSGVVVTVVTSPLGVTVTVLAALELIAATPAFCARKLITDCTPSPPVAITVL
jgi:hypothetical protein